MSYISVVSALPSCTNVWLLDEASGTSFADSVGSLTATGTGSFAAGGTSIVSGLAKSVTNTSGRAVTATGAAIGSQDFWIAAWIKTSTSTFPAVVFAIDSGFYMGLTTAGKAYISVGGSPVTGATTLNDGATHCVVWTRVSNTTRIYIDGVTTADGSAATPPLIAAGTWAIGNISAGGYPLPGTIGGVALGIGSGLTGAQAATIFAAGSGGGGGGGAPFTRNTFCNQAVNRSSTY